MPTCWPSVIVSQAEIVNLARRHLRLYDEHNRHLSDSAVGRLDVDDTPRCNSADERLRYVCSAWIRVFRIHHTLEVVLDVICSRNIVDGDHLAAYRSVPTVIAQSTEYMHQRHTTKTARTSLTNLALPQNQFRRSEQEHNEHRKLAACRARTLHFRPSAASFVQSTTRTQPTKHGDQRK